MILVFWIALCCLVGAFAHKYNRSFWLWALVSMLISPLLGGIILVIICLMTDDSNDINTTR